MHDHTFSKFANHQIRHPATLNLGCQPMNLPQGFVWVCMFNIHTFITKEGLEDIMKHKILIRFVLEMFNIMDLVGKYGHRPIFYMQMIDQVIKNEFV